jgi:hypothetical protein
MCRRAWTIVGVALAAALATGCGGSLTPAPGTGQGGSVGGVTVFAPGQNCGGLGAHSYTPTPVAGGGDAGPDAGASCTFVLPTPAEYPNNPEAIIVHIAGGGVPRDSQDLDGWSYTDASYTAIELFGSYCEDLRAGDGPLCVEFAELLE